MKFDVDSAQRERLTFEFCFHTVSVDVFAQNSAPTDKFDAQQSAAVFKGQIISKANCVFLTPANFSKKKRTKRRKKLTCYYYDISSQIFFVR